MAIKAISHKIIRVLSLTFSISLIASISVAAMIYYVDPNYGWSGSNGSADAPWTQLNTGNSSAWNTINQSLASSDVTVYFSAREAGEDADQSTTSGIGIRRTDNSTHRLTLDGMSKYNSNDLTPKWFDYSGHSRYKISIATYPIESGFEGPKRNYVTIRGFKAFAGSGKALEYWGGDHIIVEENEFAGTAISNGSLVFFQYAHRQDPADKRQNGGCTDIVFRNNVIHDSKGEALYIGGSDNTGEPAHSNVTIENNVIYNAGIWGGQGDSIDIKDGNTNVVIRGNTIYDGTEEGIRTHAQATVESNIIYNVSGSGILFNTYWGRGYSDVSIRGNIVYRNSGHGIYVYTQDSSREINNVKIERNTLIYNGLNGLTIDSTTSGGISDLSINGNIIKNNQIGIRAYGQITYEISNNNVFNNIVSNYEKISDQTGDNGNISLDPSFSDESSPEGPDGLFWTSDDGLLPLEGSPAINMGAYSFNSIRGTIEPPKNLKGK